jgi:hypothetical protein
MNASRAILPSVTKGKHGGLGEVIFVTTKTPAEVAAGGGAKKVLGLTKEKSEFVVGLGDIPKEFLRPLPGDRGGFIFYIRGVFQLPPKGKIGTPSGF